MTTTRTYKIIEHFKSGKCVMVRYHSVYVWREVHSLDILISRLYDKEIYTFRLINKKGRRE